MNNLPTTPGSRPTPAIAAPVAGAGTWPSPGAVIAPNQPPEAFRLTAPHPSPPAARTRPERAQATRHGQEPLGGPGAGLMKRETTSAESVP
jgi:hypothetical protein